MEGTGARVFIRVWVEVLIRIIILSRNIDWWGHHGYVAREVESFTPKRTQDFNIIATKANISIAIIDKHSQGL